MNGPFPAVDPIPLPAPVWLFQVLHHLTLALHFSAVFLLVGGLGLVAAFAIADRLLAPSSPRAAATRLLAGKLPIVMAYVVNFGIPPLLFAQVLYGRALYTSSVLMGALWIGVIALASAAYFLLYAGDHRAAAGRSALGVSLAAFGLLATVAFLFSTNMALMLRPERWLELSRADPRGTSLPGGDPTVLPRWLLMLAGGFAVSGAALVLLSGRASLPDDVRAFLARRGGIVAAGGAAVHLACGLWAFAVEPAAVRDGFGHSWLGPGPGVAWVVLTLSLGGAGVLSGTGRLAGPALAFVPAALGFGATASLVLARSAVRDAALRVHGFLVEDRAVETNGSVVGLFFLLFVVALGVVGWMISVAARARSPEAHDA